MCAPSVDLRRRMEEDIYLGIFFNTCLLGFLHFCNCPSSIPQNRMTSDRPPSPTARAGTHPRGPAAVSSPEQDTSRDLLHGTKRTVSSRAECTGILLQPLVHTKQNGRPPWLEMECTWRIRATACGIEYPTRELASKCVSKLDGFCTLWSTTCSVHRKSSSKSSRILVRASTRAGTHKCLHASYL